MSDKTFQQMKTEYREFYCKEIKPLLGNYNKRIRAVNLALIMQATLALLVLLLPFAVFAIKSPFWWVFYFILVILSAVGVIYAYSQKDAVYVNEMALKTPFMEKCMSIFLDNVTWEKDFPSSNKSSKIGARNNCGWWAKLKDIKSQYITKNFFIALFDDIIYGQYKGMDIAIYETIADTTSGKILPYLIIMWIVLYNIVETLLEKILEIDFGLTLPIIFAICIMFWFIDNKISRKFRGLIVEFNIPKNFIGHTFFVPKSYTKNINFNKKQYKPVKLEYSEFSQKYNVFSDNQVEARYMLTPAMMEKLNQLEFAFKVSSIGCSFKGSKMTLSIDTGKDMFAMGKEYRQTDKRIFEIFYDEIISILQIVDELNLNKHTGL